MSVRAMTAVWEDSLSRGNHRLVLLAIADIAGDDGTGCIMRQEKIAQKAGISLRTLQRCVADLIEQDELRVDRENTRTTNDYIVVVAWKRAVADEVACADRSDERKRNTRQLGGSPVKSADALPETGEKDATTVADNATHANLAGVTRHDSGDNQTRQIDGGKSDTAATVGWSDAPPVGVSDPYLIHSLPPRARDVKLTSVERPRRGSLIGRGEGVHFHRRMERQHASCHPEVCNWRDDAVRECMPLALVSRYAQKLHGWSEAAAVANVIAWARADAPPADYVAPSDIYAHWGIRWDLTRSTNATASRSRASSMSDGARVPGASDTDDILREITAGRGVQL